MKAFVTGSTGLLGSNLVHALVEAGYQVKALARSREKAAKILAGTGAEIVIGDMENVEAFVPALDGCDVLFHTAAYFREYFGPGDHWGTLKRINVDGTIKLLTEAEKRGLKKAIYVSSSGVLGQRKNGAPADESTGPDANAMANLYFRSKVVAEEAVADFLKTQRLPVVMILPTAMFGPRDAAPTGAGQIVLDFMAGKMPAIPPGGFSVVDVRDVTAAMVKAVEKGKSGERYIIGGDYYSFGDIFRLLSQITGVPAPARHLPYAAALAYAWLSERQAQLTGKRPTASVNAIRGLRARREVNMAKARRELGVTLRPFEQTLRDEVDWFRQNGYIASETRPAVAPV